jgi:hypothetical protein
MLVTKKVVECSGMEASPTTRSVNGRANPDPQVADGLLNLWDEDMDRCDAVSAKEGAKTHFNQSLRLRA